MLRFRHVVLPVAAALVSFFAVAVPAHASTSYKWIGNSQDSNCDNHSWQSACNWQPNGVPGTGDSVTIDHPDANHCTVHVDSVPDNLSLAALTIQVTAGGCGTTISGGSITVTGSFSWDGGALDTATTIAGGATGTVSGTNGKGNALGAELDVSGSLTLTGLTDARPTGANTALFFSNYSQVLLHVLAGGTLTSSGANQVEVLGCCSNPNALAKIVNDGTLNVDSGDFTMDGAEVDQKATLHASSGGRLVSDVAPLTAADGATYTGSGGWVVTDGASLTATGTQNIGTGFAIQLGGLAQGDVGKLSGSATLTGAGEFDWVGGTIGGNLTLAPGFHTHVTGAHTVALGNTNSKQVVDGSASNGAATITNHGTMTVDDGAGVYMSYQSPYLTNASDGTLSLAPGTQIAAQGCCVSPSKVVNHGKLTVPTGSSNDPVVLGGVAYQSDATTTIAAGRVLQVNSAPSSLLSATVSGGGTLAVAAPTAVSGTITVGSGSALDLQNHGSLDGSATIGGAGALQWTGGAFSGNVTVSVGGGVAVSGTDTKHVANVGGGSTGSKLTLKTDTSVAAGTDAAHDYISIDGASTLALASRTTLRNFTEIYGGRLLNTGSLTVKAGSSGTGLRSGALTNRGKVTASSGTFQVYDYTQSGGTTTIAHGATLTSIYTSRSITLNGGVLEGTGTVDEGVTNTAGTVKPAGTSTGTLHVTGSYVQGKNGTLALDLAAKSRDLLAVAGAVTLDGKLTAHNVGSYHPSRGAKFKVLSSAGLTYSLNCATTSGTGSKTGHWAVSHTATGVSVTWRPGAHRHC